MTVPCPERDGVFSWFAGWGAVVGMLCVGRVKGAGMKGRGWRHVEVWGCLAGKWLKMTPFLPALLMASKSFFNIRVPPGIGQNDFVCWALPLPLEAMRWWFGSLKVVVFEHWASPRSLENHHDKV